MKNYNTVIYLLSSLYNHQLSHSILTIYVASILLSILTIAQDCYAQDSQLYMPINIQKAYNNTRSYEGKPLPNYFVNQANYTIQVTFDPQTYQLQGTQQIEYLNNSPDSLNIIVIQLLSDFFKNNAIRDFAVDPRDLHNGTTLHKIIVNNKTIDQHNNNEFSRNSTNCIIKLSDKIAPKTITNITIEWEFPFPRYSTIRYGAYDSTSFFVGYWYPSIAVYDDINGWNGLQFTGLQEYYNDFANFDVSITVPSQYVVWATGELQNADLVLHQDTHTKYTQALTSDSVIHIITQHDLASNRVTQTHNKWNTWKFIAQKVPDFSFALSDHYLWDATKLTLQNGNNVLVQTAYPEGTHHFAEMVQIAKQSIQILSQNAIKTDYPYPQMTLFKGNGGMEYPMMVNQGDPSDIGRAINVTVHEIAHTWFPFYMGTNEQRYAWMDESFVAFFSLDTDTLINPNITSYYDYNLKNSIPLLGTDMDIPAMTPSYQLKVNKIYRINSYYKGAIALYFLRQYLGDETFYNAMTEYIKRWSGKHPLPYDFFFTINNLTGENLDWFWKPFFFEQGYPDLGFSDVNFNKNTVQLTITQYGNQPLPIHLTFTLENGQQIQIIEPLQFWKHGTKEYHLKHTFASPIKNITLGNDRIPDVNTINNYIENL